MDLIHKTLDWKSVNKNVIKMFEFYVKKTLSHQFFCGATCNCNHWTNCKTFEVHCLRYMNINDKIQRLKWAYAVKKLFEKRRSS